MRWVRMISAVILLPVADASADVVTFFDPSQTIDWLVPATTSDTAAINGYKFTYTRDKLFTGGAGLTEPIGRYLRVNLPDGLEAQAVTSGPVTGGAKITIARVDGKPFDLTSFTFELLANTAGAGGTLEIMPKLNGEDGLPNPVFFNATGVSYNTFSYSTVPNYAGQGTAALTGFDSYTMSLYVDFALMDLSVQGDPVPEPAGFVLAALAAPALLRRRRFTRRRGRSRCWPGAGRLPPCRAGTPVSRG